jgi:glycosyltransferase involved in cell wall biosynthesis
VNRYRAVHQFHAATATGDAITQQMLHLQKHLVGMGLPSEIFTQHRDPSLSNRIRWIHDYEGSDENLLLLHHSQGNSAFEDVVALPDEIVAVYHNITPDQYFTDEESRRLAVVGRSQLVALAERSHSGVADSNYNRREMLTAGFHRVEVLPVRTDFSEFIREQQPDRQGSDWLYVGRIVENKCQHDLVHAFAAYTRSFDNRARLVLIGDTARSDYVRFVREEAARLGIGDRVSMPGKVSDTELTAAFAAADVFVSLSEHEGFGVPILEAMAAGVPVVAFSAGAVPETMAGAGILLRTKDAMTVAATVRCVFSDPDLRRRLVERQHRRIRQVQAFDTPRLLTRVIERAGGVEHPFEVQVQGPFETSYSFAIMNRKLALGLDRVPGLAASIFATEGPGDYEPRPSDLENVVEATALYDRGHSIAYPDAVIRQMWPPRVVDSPGPITCEYFAWEESRVPSSMVDDFNRYLDGIGVTSHFVEQALRDSGVIVPIRVVGNGVEIPDPAATIGAPELDALRGFRFLHVGSGFPRKGVDILLEAYFSEFDGADDVSLILKTFPNPHNEVGPLLERLRAQHPNSPDVRWIDRDIKDENLQALYYLTSCYVHPARGEGFGLTVAEAMAAGVPVISVAYSGLADFVSETTAITIPFVVTPAATHVSVPGSTWAEPDRQQLAVEMRRLVNQPNDPMVLERVGRARELITSEFSWDAAVKRWVNFLDDLESAAATLRVAMIAPWNSRCGIAEYTRYLVDHGKPHVQCEIFADQPDEVVDLTAEVGITRCWSDRWHPELYDLEEGLRLSDAEVVHCQFNFGFFELEHLAGVIDRLLASKGVVITLHRTADAEIDGAMVSLADIRDTLGRVDRLIVHQEADRQRLAAMGIADNVSVIAHGTASPIPVSPIDVRKAAGFGSRPLIGTFGFLLPHKGTVRLVEAVSRLRDEFPDICLVALCARHPDGSSEQYEETVREAIDRYRLQDNVALITEYLADDVARTLLRTTDVIALPYVETPESASGALRFVLPAGRAVIATDLPVFADCRGCVLTIDPADPNALEDSLRRVLTDSDLQDDLAERAATAARRFSWARVAADHREIYAAARRARASR